LAPVELEGSSFYPSLIPTVIVGDVHVIYLYHQNIDGIWHGAAMKDEKVYVTLFATTEKKVLQELLESLPYNLPFQLAEKPSLHSMKLIKTLKMIFDGKDVTSNFETVMDYMPKYTQKVLKCVAMVPVGYITTYGAVAKAVGGSPRAVGNAMAFNPFALLIPCHRVVRADFSVGGYGLNGDVKRKILQREDRGYKENVKLKINDETLSVFPVKRLKAKNKS
jgi:methylated-DNA-[protein]-cysteine S-methyltransferase